MFYDLGFDCYKKLRGDILIPKIIHYTWFGKNEMPEKAIENLNSWKKHCPNYEFKLWNEDNFDVSSHEFTKYAYKLKKYAFVSDVVRLYAVYTEGGIYFDLGVEMFKSIDDLVNSCDAFFAFQNEILITTGLGFGADKGNIIVKNMLEVYNNIDITEDTKFSSIACPKFNTQTLVKICPQIKMNGMAQNIDGIRLLSCSEYSTMFKNMGFKSWVTDKEKIVIREYKDTALKRFLKKEKFISYCNSHNNILSKAYLFFTYELLEYGFLHYLKKLKIKLQKT